MRVIFSKAFLLVIGFCLVSTNSYPQHDLELCGDQGEDNRPNWCNVPNEDGDLARNKSGCEEISATEFLYIHCSGKKTKYVGDNQWCRESDECPGAYYIVNPGNAAE